MTHTRRGRGIVVRNSVMVVAWFMVEHQVQPDLESMMEAWRKLAWELIHAWRRMTVRRCG